jgi:hypothetical protein
MPIVVIFNIPSISKLCIIKVKKGEKQTNLVDRRLRIRKGRSAGVDCLFVVLKCSDRQC